MEAQPIGSFRLNKSECDRADLTWHNRSCVKLVLMERAVMDQISQETECLQYSDTRWIDGIDGIDGKCYYVLHHQVQNDRTESNCTGNEFEWHEEGYCELELYEYEDALNETECVGPSQIWGSFCVTDAFVQHALLFIQFEGAGAIVLPNFDDQVGCENASWVPAND